MSKSDRVIVPAIDGKPNCHLDCVNYGGLMCDLESAIEEMQRLIYGETTAERAHRWVKINWPKLYRAPK